MQHFQVYISAENKKQANTVLNSLLKKRLVAGGMYLKGPAKFWWKGKIVEMEYYNISTFTIELHKQAIIDDVKQTSLEEVPMVWFVPFSGNEEFLEWIEQAVVS